MEQNLILDINRISKKLMISDLFYGLFLSTIEKKEDNSIPLAAVSLNRNTMDFCLLINKIEWFKFSDEVKYAVLKHECLHLTLFHLINQDRFPDHKRANIGMDLEINYIIGKDKLPSWGCFIEDFEQKYPKLDWKRNAGAKHYYDELGKLSDKEKEELGIDEKAKHQWIIVDGEGNPTGEELTDAMKDAIRVQVEHTIEGIAEEMIKSQGHVPAEIDQLIKGFVKPKPAYNYLKWVRNFVGNSNVFFIKTSKLKENQRFSGQPAVVLKQKQRVLLLEDQSGSVSEKELCEINNEAFHLMKKVDIEVRSFDTEIGPLVKIAKNGSYATRNRCGGTDILPCIEYFEKRKDIDTCIIFSDGHFSPTRTTNKNLLIVITSNGTLENVKNHKNVIKIPAS